MAIFGRKQIDETPAVGPKTPVNKPAVGAEKQPPPAPEPAVGKEAVIPRKEGGEDSEGSRLVVGSHVRLTGSEITDCDTVIVEGRVEATVDGRVMQITETGMFSGTVTIDMAEIRGQYHGELTVRKRLTVCGTGKVKGKVRYGTLVVEEGGELSGDVDSLSMTSSATGSTKPKETLGTPLPGSKPEGTPDYPSSRSAAA